MPAAPLPYNERARCSVVAELGLMPTEHDRDLDRLIRQAAVALKVPTAVLSIVDSTRQWFKARVGMALAETSREVAFCGYTILGTAPMIIPDALDDPRFVDNALVTGEPGLRFYAGVPIIVKDMPIGAVCGIDYKPRQVDAEQVRDLVRIATLAARRIAVMAALSEASPDGYGRAMSPPPKPTRSPWLNRPCDQFLESGETL